MNSLTSFAPPVTSSQLPVAIDYPAALALRQMAAQHDEYPQYLLTPEVSALLHYVPDLYRKMLFTTLWNTGARTNEALALRRGDFSLAPPYFYVQLATLKQRSEKLPTVPDVHHQAWSLTGWFRCPISSTFPS